MRQLQGISHVTLTVADMAGAKRFWTQVMGFDVAMEVSGFCLCLHRGAGVAVGFKNHDGKASGMFDETKVRLDHLALAVGSRGELEELQNWLSQQRVEHSPIQETELGHHLNLRAPDRLAIELFTLGPAGAADLGLG